VNWPQVNIELRTKKPASHTIISDRIRPPHRRLEWPAMRARYALRAYLIEVVLTHWRSSEAWTVPCGGAVTHFAETFNLYIKSRK
jgi:hypothetical protein